MFHPDDNIVNIFPGSISNRQIAAPGFAITGKWNNATLRNVPLSDKDAFFRDKCRNIPDIHFF